MVPKKYIALVLLTYDNSAIMVYTNSNPVKPTIYQLEHCPTLQDLLVDTGYIKKPNFVYLWLSVKWHHSLWAIMAIFDKKE